MVSRNRRPVVVPVQAAGFRLEEAQLRERLADDLFGTGVGERLDVRQQAVGERKRTRRSGHPTVRECLVQPARQDDRDLAVGIEAGSHRGLKRGCRPHGQRRAPLYGHIANAPRERHRGRSRPSARTQAEERPALVPLGDGDGAFGRAVRRQTVQRPGGDRRLRRLSGPFDVVRDTHRNVEHVVRRGGQR